MASELEVSDEIGTENDPNSLVSRLSKKAEGFKGLIAKALDSDYGQLTTEKEFIKAYGEGKDYEIVRLLRFSFWQEHAYSIEKGNTMVLDRVYTGICRSDKFTKLLKQPLNVMYLITRPIKLEIMQASLIQYGYEEIKKILNLPIEDAKGNVNVSLIKEKVKILENLENRHYGGVVQRAQVHQKTEIEHKNVSPEKLAGQEKELLLTQIAELEKRLGKKKKGIIEDAEIVEND